MKTNKVKRAVGSMLVLLMAISVILGTLSIGAMAVFERPPDELHIYRANNFEGSDLQYFKYDGNKQVKTYPYFTSSGEKDLDAAAYCVDPQDMSPRESNLYKKEDHLIEGLPPLKDESKAKWLEDLMKLIILNGPPYRTEMTIAPEEKEYDIGGKKYTLNESNSKLDVKDIKYAIQHALRYMVVNYCELKTNNSANQSSKRNYEQIYLANNIGTTKGLHLPRMEIIAMTKVSRVQH